MAEIHLTGRAASPGLAIGPVTMLTAAVARRTASGDPAQETAALQAAIEGATAEIVEQIKTIQGEVADILEFQVAMLEDDALADAAYEAISAGVAADHAWRSALDAEIAGYRAAEDEYFRARAADIVDIRDRVLAHLSGVDTVARITGGSIVAADDITPSAFLAADWSRGGAIALAAGSPSSHVAMLARARGAPMVVGLGPLSWNGQPPALALVDGDAGTVIFDPEPETRRLFEQRMAAANAAQAAAEAAVSRQPIRPTAGGSRFCSTSPHPKTSRASIPRSATASASCARNFCSRRLTACRTRTRNTQVYRRILDWAEGRPVTIRTLDAGGDKPIAGLDDRRREQSVSRPSRHPPLACAAGGVSRAIAGAVACGCARGAESDAADDRRSRRNSIAPASCSTRSSRRSRRKGSLAPDRRSASWSRFRRRRSAPRISHAEFYSIGSNDLTQYTMAAARDIGAVADLNDAGHPAVLALIARTVEAATQARRRGLALRRRCRRHPPDDGAARDRADDASRWRR